jgi:hypothetical protein
MSAAARTMIAFAVYIAITGATLLVAPNALLALVGLPPTQEIWLRVLGMQIVVVAYYYYRASVSEATGFFRATVLGRTAMGVFLTGLAVTGMTGPALVLFGLLEFAGAIWTGLALRSSSAH